MMDSGVLPIMFLASTPIARILLSCSETATTEGSFKTMPFPGRNTKVLAVPKSIPNFLVKTPIFTDYSTAVLKFKHGKRAEKSLQGTLKRTQEKAEKAEEKTQSYTRDREHLLRTSRLGQ